MKIDDILQGIPVNAVLRERLALLVEDNQRLEKREKEHRTRAEQAEKQVGMLQEERDKLLGEIVRQRKEIERLSGKDDSIEFQGVIFKHVTRGPDGVEVDCAKCRTPLSVTPRDGRFVCNSCGFIGWFNRNGLPNVLAKLPKTN